MHRKLILMASSALLAAAIGSTAHAQAANTIEELVVTAEKRAQSLQDVPVAVSAFTSEKRDLIGINTIADMTNFTPGLEYNASNDRNTLRGLGRLTNVHAADISVAQYSDGVYTSSTVEAGKTPLFVDRIEVLRGPQGTLYGRNSIGGAINIISKRPTEDWYAEARAQYQNFNHFIVEAATSGPTLIPGVQFRIGANWEKQTEGWFENVVPGVPDEGGIINQQYVEGQLKFNFNDNFEGWVKYAWANWDNDGGGPGQRTGYTVLTVPGTGPGGTGDFPTYQTSNPGFFVQAGYACFPTALVTNVVTAGGVPLSTACTNPAKNDPRKYSSTIDAMAKLTGVAIFSSEFTYHLPSMDLKYIAGGTHYNYFAVLPIDWAGVTQFTLPNIAAPGAPGAVVNPREASQYREQLNWISHELNLSSTDSGPFQWIVGLYYYDEDYNQPTAGWLPDESRLDGPFITNATCAFTVTCPAMNGERRFYDSRPSINTESRAAYGQIDWQFTETWKTTLGVRYTYDRKYGFETGRLVCFDVTGCVGFPPEAIGNFLVDLTQIPVVVTNGVTPGSPGSPGVAGGVSSLTTFDPATGFATRHYDDNWSAVTGTAGVQWEPDADTMAYFRYSRGYKAGGFNIGNGGFFGADPETNPEHVNAFEVGLKKTFAATLQANAAIFYYDYQGMQVPISIVPTSGALSGTSQSVFYNVPKAVSQGFELETIWQPIDNLQVLFNYSYLDATVKDARGVVDPADPTAVQPGATPESPLASCTPGQTACDAFTQSFTRGQNLDGNHLPNAPENKVAFNVNYTWDLAAGSLTAGATYVWRSEQYGSIFDRDYYRSPSWDQVDLRATWKDIDNKYTVIAFVKNVFDDLGYEAGATAGRRAGYLPPFVLGRPGLTPVPVNQGIATTYILTPPRTFGIEVQYRFF